VFGKRDAGVEDVEKRESFRRAAGGRFVRRGRLGSLRAGSRVIRAHWVRRLIDEHGRARITRSPALADSAGGVIIFLDGLGVPGWLIVRSELDFGCC